MRLYRDSILLRLTVSQELREVILPVDEGGDHPPGSYRRVQIIIPPSPVVYATTVMDADLVAGQNRDYKLPPLRAGTTIDIKLRPHQSLWMCAKKGIAECTGIIEYIEE